MSQKDLKAKLSAYPDATLCQMVKKGDNLAFEEITHRYKGIISSISKEFSYPGFDDGDFFQLGLMGLFGACSAFDENEKISFKNFAALCIRRKYLTLIRSLSSQKVIPSQAVVSIEEAEFTANYQHNPEELLLDKENTENFLNIVRSRLSHMEFCVMTAYVNGKSYKEIAESLGLDSKAVDNALQRVRKKLLN